MFREKEKAVFLMGDIMPKIRGFLGGDMAYIIERKYREFAPNKQQSAKFAL